MITLHESNITSFPHDNGIGVLRDVIRAYAEEELNGMFEFYMEYDSEGHLVDELKEERIIKAKAQDKLGYQLFRIYSITKNHENDNLIVRAQHITYDLADNFVEKLEANNLTKKQVMELIGSSTVLPHPFNVTSSNTTTRSSTKLYRTNPLQMIGGIEGSVLQIWGGQIERDNFNLILHDRRGSDDGVKVTYEKNITGLEATFDISGLVTRIFPFVFIEGSDNEPDRLITVNGKYIDSPHINDYEKIYIKPIDYSHDERINTDGTDAQIRQQLTNIASQYFKETGNDKIKVDMEVRFEHLWETEEYKDLAVLELVGMGDTVTIEHSRLKVDATAIVNYIRYDCIAEKNEEVRLGSVKARLTDSVNRVVDVAEKVEQAEQTANQAIRAANGKNTIYYGPDEPEGGIEGDLWFRVVDGEYTRTYRHDGIQWQLVLSVDVRDAIDEAQQAKDEAQQAVDRANQATQQATDAINQAQTAFDEAQAALGTANNAMAQATNAFTTANQAFSEVESLSTIVDENTGEISTIKQSVIGLQTQVSDNAGNISSLTQIAQGLQTQVTDIEGNVSTLQQTASGLQSSVTNLQDELDGLEIGGRNLLLDSNDFTKFIKYAGATVNFTTGVSVPEWNATDATRIQISGGTSVLKLYKTVIAPSVSGQDYTVSVWIKNIGSYPVVVANNLPLGISMVNPGESKRVIITSKGNGLAYLQVRFQTTTGNENNPLDFIVWRAKAEHGNRATDWSPAPEDIDHQFSTIIQTIDSITTRVGDAEGNITTLQQTSSSLAARLSDAEGNITTLTATVNGLQTTVTNVQGDVSSVTQLANALQVRMTNAEGDISTLTQTASSLQSTVSSLQDEWDNLEIGGRNLVQRSNEFNSGSAASGITASLTPEGYLKVVTTSGNGNWHANWWKVRTGIEEHFSEGETFTVSLTIKRTAGTGKPTIYIKDGMGYYSLKGDLGNQFTTLYYSGTWKKANAVNPHLGWSGTNGTFIIKNWKIEKGNRATDWTPAPEDMATQSQITQLSDAINLRVKENDVINQINISTESILIDGRKVHITGQTTIDNGVIKSAHIESLDAGKITTGTLDAGKISVINLSANSIVGGVLSSQTNNTTFNLNTGELHMANADITLAGGARIHFTDTGNQMLHTHYDSISGFTRSAGFGVGRAIGNRYPFAYMGANNNPFLDTLGQYFSGFIANSVTRIANDNAANAVYGNRFRFINNTAYDKGITIDFFGSTTEISSWGNHLNIGNLDRLYGLQAFSIRNYYNNLSGWLIETNYSGDGSAITFRGLNAGSYNYQIGSASSRILNIYLRNNPNVSSDQRLKTEINDLPHGLEVIKQLNPVSFRLKIREADMKMGKDKNELQFGLIAQDTKLVMQSLGYDTSDMTLIKEDEEGMLSMSYTELIPFLIKSDQDLDLKIESVKDDVEWLKLENQYLKQKVKQLEGMIA